MKQPDALARQCHRRHLVGMLKASNAKRLMRKGATPEQAAKDAGYLSVHAMRNAIRLYTKSTAPAGTQDDAREKTQ